MLKQIEKVSGFGLTELTLESVKFSLKSLKAINSTASGKAEGDTRRLISEMIPTLKVSKLIVTIIAHFQRAEILDSERRDAPDAVKFIAFGEQEKRILKI